AQPPLQACLAPAVAHPKGFALIWVARWRTPRVRRICSSPMDLRRLLPSLQLETWPATRLRGTCRDFTTDIPWWNGRRDLPPSDSSAIIPPRRDDPPKFLNFFLSTGAFLLYKTGSEEFIDLVSRQILLGIAVLIFILPPASADPFPDAGPVVSGNVARLRFGRAAAPKHAPLAVKRAIW